MTGADDHVETATEGEFIIVDMTITNVGDQQDLYGATEQTLRAGDKQYVYDGAATFTISSNAASPIDPGSAMDTSVVYDVQPETQPDGIELHDDPGSPGAYVTLG